MTSRDIKLADEVINKEITKDEALEECDDAADVLRLIQLKQSNRQLVKQYLTREYLLNYYNLPNGKVYRQQVLEAKREAAEILKNAKNLRRLTQSEKDEIKDREDSIDYFAKRQGWKRNKYSLDISTRWLQEINTDLDLDISDYIEKQIDRINEIKANTADEAEELAAYKLDLPNNNRRLYMDWLKQTKEANVKLVAMCGPTLTNIIADLLS